ncbi:MAG: hypothetical protein U1D30_23000 [Planctomycetota bacterium]
MKPMSFDELRDPATGRPFRAVDISGESFQVALRYMIRLEAKDKKNPEQMWWPRWRR